MVFILFDDEFSIIEYITNPKIDSYFILVETLQVRRSICESFMYQQLAHLFYCYFLAIYPVANHINHFYYLVHSKMIKKIV